MNDFEVAKLPNGLEEYLSGFQPAKCIIWDQQKGKYIEDTSSKALEEYKKGCEVFKDTIREIYAFGESIVKGTPKFCLSLQKVYNFGKYVEDPDAEVMLRYGGISLRDSMDTQYGFKSLLGRLGISESAGYRYKDLAKFVDPTTGDYYSEFKGYSISLLSEIHSIASKGYDTSLRRLKEQAELIPSDTTIEDMKLYKKALSELSCYGDSLFESYSYTQRWELKKKSLPEVLKVYKELVQKAEAKKLEETMSGVQTVAKEDKSVKVLPAADEMIVKKFDYENLRTWAQRAQNIGKCDGCKHNGTNLNKCRCCRRYESLKDLFEQNS